MKICSLLILLLVSFSLMAQTDILTQEEAEQRALEAYEKENPPRKSIPMPATAEFEEYFGARIARTVSLLTTSSKEQRYPVKILIYGQSIVGSTHFTKNMKDYLTTHFPYADLTLENRAIGGFSGERIARTAVHDVYPSYPDLVIFHVYGGEEHGDLEQLFTNIKKYTTAEILLFNHHISGGQRTYEESSYQYIRYLANKYNCEFVDVSKEWSRYLTDNALVPSDLLRDGVHPNQNGNWLLSQLIGRHFRYNTLFPNDWQDRVKTVFLKSAYDVNGEIPISFNGEKWKIIENIPVGKSKENPLKITFTGNRIDVISGKLKDAGKPGSARVFLDGKPIEQADPPFAITRPTAGPNTWWPLVRRISYTEKLISENWTLRVDKINADSTVWFFSVIGSKTGYDGSGRTDESFVSKSGRVVIDVSDYVFTDIKKSFKTVTPVGFESTWSVEPMFIETFSTPVIEDASKVYKTTLVKGIINGTHTLELVPNGDGVIPIEAFEIYKPALE